MRHGRVRALVVSVVAVAVAGVAACGSSDEPSQSSEEAQTAALTAYAGVAHQQYTEALAGAKSLKTSIDAFLAAPSDATQRDAQSAWKASRPAYLRTEVFRFYDGPIDNADTGREGAINAWPLDEAYIDYVEGQPNAGIINNPGQFPDVTATVIDDQNEKGGEKNISTGYHAIEFLLLAQDYKMIYRIDRFGPGETKTLAVELPAGTYLLECHIVKGVQAHSQLGMSAPLKVT